MSAASDHRSPIAPFPQRREVSPLTRNLGAHDDAGPGEAVLQAYVDDALTPDGRARFVARLAAEPDAAARVAAYVRQKATLRRLLGAFPAEPRPDVARSTRRLARQAARAAAPTIDLAFRKPARE